ncbi:MAG TPA: hypothetical protein VH415_00290 [Nitrososphaeraceae archaeon]
MNRQYLYMAGASVLAIMLLLYFMNQKINRSPFGLEVDATKDSTDMAGTYYRVRVTNVGTNIVSNISVYLGPNDVQHLNSLAPDQTWFFYPSPDTDVSIVEVNAENGINITTDFRSPLKGLGLPGSGR